MRENKIHQRLWLLFGLYFILVCSGPVKKFIRIELSHTHGIHVKNNSLQFCKKEVKDCTILHDENGFALLDTNSVDVLDPHFFFTLLSFGSAVGFLVFITKTARTAKHIFPSPRSELAIATPAYIRYRHLLI